MLQFMPIWLNVYHIILIRAINQNLFGNSSEKGSENQSYEFLITMMKSFALDQLLLLIIHL